MNLFHPVIDKLLLLRQNATPGVWGPTSEPPRAPEDSNSYFFLKKGERGEPSWGAVVSDVDPRPNGKDHERYTEEPYSYYYEPGTDMYGGTLIGESLRDGNGEYIAALHNNLPGLTQTIRNLRAELINLGFNPIRIDELIADSMEGKDAS